MILWLYLLPPCILSLISRQTSFLLFIFTPKYFFWFIFTVNIYFSKYKIVFLYIKLIFFSPGGNRKFSFFFIIPFFTNFQEFKCCLNYILSLISSKMTISFAYAYIDPLSSTSTRCIWFSSHITFSRSFYIYLNYQSTLWSFCNWNSINIGKMYGITFKLF